MKWLPRLSWIALLTAMLLAGCATRSGGPAPVEDRGTSASRGNAPATAAAPGVAPTGADTPAAVQPAPRQPPGFENAGKPGYYAVKPGDTLIRIGLEHGQNWRDIARWSGIDNPNVIEVGQIVRVVPPVPEAAVAVSKPVVIATLPAASTPSAAPAAAKPASSASAAAAPSPAAPAAAAASAPASGDEIEFLWPAGGQVLAGFDEAKNKGLDISGKAGDPVVAAADGRVVYAGSGLRGYGNLVILKHNNTYLTAYAHNQTLLVREDQAVRRGQKIAEMGSSESDRVQLHFEIRRMGKPIDPARLLPAR